MGREQKAERKGVGEGKEGNACPQTPRFWKTRSPTNGAPDWCGMVILIDKCIKFVWMITVITRAWLAYVISESFFKNLSAAAFKLSYAKIKQEPADFDSLIWQLRLALLSHFTCPDNERPNLRSRRLLVVFHAKANSLALAIFKQRIPISGWFYISTVTTVFVDTRLWENKTPAETFPKFPSVLLVIDRSDRNPPITAR